MVECPGSSPLYRVLAAGIAEDPYLLSLARRVRPGQPPSNMLLAAVHHELLFGDTGHELARYYPNIAVRPLAVEGAFTAFRDFCRRFEDPITDLSAGFNLLWDQYAYDYGAAGRIETETAPFVLYCDVRNHQGFGIDLSLPAIGTRMGIDPFAIDVGDPDDRQWLQALVWPEHQERAERLRSLLDWIPSRRPAVIREDGVEAIVRAIRDLGTEGLACVFHSFVLNQFSETAKSSFHARLRSSAAARPVVRIGMEWDREAGAVVLDAEHHHGDKSERTVLATCDAHGRWLDWTGSPSRK